MKNKFCLDSFIRTTTGRTSTETLYNKDCQVEFGESLQTNLTISEDVVPSLHYFDNIGVKLLPPSVVYYFETDELHYL